MSEVSGSGLECQAATAQEQLRGATLCRGQGRRPRGATPCLRPVVAGRRHPRPRSGAAGRSHLAPEARGGDPEEPHQARGHGQQLGGATQTRGQSQRPGGTTRGAVAVQAQGGLEELSHVEGQEWWR